MPARPGRRSLLRSVPCGTAIHGGGPHRTHGVIDAAVGSAQRLDDRAAVRIEVRGRHGVGQRLQSLQRGDTEARRLGGGRGLEKARHQQGQVLKQRRGVVAGHDALQRARACQAHRRVVHAERVHEQGEPGGEVHAHEGVGRARQQCRHGDEAWLSRGTAAFELFCEGDEHRFHGALAVQAAHHKAARRRDEAAVQRKHTQGMRRLHAEARVLDQARVQRVEHLLTDRLGARQPPAGGPDPGVQGGRAHVGRRVGYALPDALERGAVGRRPLVRERTEKPVLRLRGWRHRQHGMQPGRRMRHRGSARQSDHDGGAGSVPRRRRVDAGGEGAGHLGRHVRPDEDEQVTGVLGDVRVRGDRRAAIRHEALGEVLGVLAHMRIARGHLLLHRDVQRDDHRTHVADVRRIRLACAHSLQRIPHALRKERKERGRSAQPSEGAEDDTHAQRWRLDVRRQVVQEVRHGACLDQRGMRVADRLETLERARPDVVVRAEHGALQDMRGARRVVCVHAVRHTHKGHEAAHTMHRRDGCLGREQSEERLAVQRRRGAGQHVEVRREQGPGTRRRLAHEDGQHALCGRCACVWTGADEARQHEHRIGRASGVHIAHVVDARLEDHVDVRMGRAKHADHGRERLLSDRHDGGIGGLDDIEAHVRPQVGGVSARGAGAVHGHARREGMQHIEPGGAARRAQLLEKQRIGHRGKRRRRRQTRPQRPLEVVGRDAEGIVRRRAERDGEVAEEDVVHRLRLGRLQRPRGQKRAGDAKEDEQVAWVLLAPHEPRVATHKRTAVRAVRRTHRTQRAQVALDERADHVVHEKAQGLRILAQIEAEECRRDRAGIRRHGASRRRQTTQHTQRAHTLDQHAIRLHRTILLGLERRSRRTRRHMRRLVHALRHAVAHHHGIRHLRTEKLTERAHGLARQALRRLGRHMPHHTAQERDRTRPHSVILRREGHTERLDDVEHRVRALRHSLTHRRRHRRFRAADVGVARGLHDVSGGTHPAAPLPLL